VLSWGVTTLDGDFVPVIAIVIAAAEPRGPSTPHNASIGVLPERPGCATMPACGKAKILARNMLRGVEKHDETGR
jgi:hypothetical protein